LIFQEENGLSRIEVQDNGCGIKREDAQVMAQRSYTSKINCFESLNELTTYGFRGEALCSLCAVSNVSITTKTKDNAVAICYTLGQSGKVFSTKPVPSSTGTTIVVTNLFKNLPVRKQFLSTKKKCKEELKKVEELIMSFGCIHPGVRLVLWHNKSIIWQKGKVNDYKTSLVTVLGTPVMSQMDKVQHEDQEYSFQFTGYLPKIDSNPSVTCRANNDRCFIFVNERPVLIKEVSQVSQK
jgi:DNA mismatch repair protein PMS1